MKKGETSLLIITGSVDKVAYGNRMLINSSDLAYGERLVCPSTMTMWALKLVEALKDLMLIFLQIAIWSCRNFSSFCWRLLTLICLVRLHCSIWWKMAKKHPKRDIGNNSWQFSLVSKSQLVSYFGEASCFLCAIQDGIASFFPFSGRWNRRGNLLT